MNILNFNNNYNLNFNAASDLTLKYILEKRSQYLPERVLNAAKTAETQPKVNQPSLKALHKDVYEKLYNAKSLEEAKVLYPEFSDVISIDKLDGKPSKALKIISAIMPLKDFTLQYLKDLYALVTEENIAKKYGFATRSMLQWLNRKLNIPKPKKEYIQLVKMTDETENNRIAEFTIQQIKNNPEAHRAISQKGAAAQKKPEARERKRIQMIEFYKNNPQYTRQTQLISLRTWEKCPKIKQALSEYTAAQNNITRKILEKRTKNKQCLTDNEKTIISGYYKKFWNAHPEYVAKYREARKEAIEELKNEGLIPKFGLNNSGS